MVSADDAAAAAWAWARCKSPPRSSYCGAAPNISFWERTHTCLERASLLCSWWKRAEAEAARLLLQLIVVELRVFAFYLLPVPRMRFCLQTFFFSMGEDISECGGSGRESSQGYGVPEDVSHYDYYALEVAADGGATRIAEGEEW
jgi:hypothetical protein